VDCVELVLKWHPAH